MPPSHGIAKNLRQRSTDAERLLWSKLRNRQVENCKFRRQQPIGKYVVDLVCFERKLIIELDGGQHALQEDEDAIRTEFLKADGYQVLRFWNNQVFGDWEAVLQAIYLALAHAAYPSPNPLPQGERAIGAVLGHE
jgi:very-short-patch-repair endonuclease